MIKVTHDKLILQLSSGERERGKRERGRESEGVEGGGCEGGGRERKSKRLCVLEKVGRRKKFRR